MRIPDRNRWALLCSVLIAAPALVSCHNEPAGPLYGTIAVTVKTQGDDLDNGYIVSVGAERRTMTPNGITYLTVSPGQQTISIDDVATNCVTDGPSSVSVDVGKEETVNVSFVINCFATGLQFVIQTAGPELPSGFTLSLSSRGLLRVPVNGTLTITRLEPGPYSISVEVPSACSLTGPNEVNVQLPPRTVLPVTFKAECVPPERLEKVAFVLDTTAGTSNISWIALTTPDGAGEQHLELGDNPAWSPDGKRLLYVGTECDDYYYYYFCSRRLHTRDPETGADYLPLVGLTPEMGSWSPTGDLIAFTTWNTHQLYLIPPAGGNPSLIPLPAGLLVYDVAWSPNGNRLAFTCGTGGFTQICVSDKNGANVVHLTPDSVAASRPAWSKDGTTIAFTAVHASPPEIQIISAAGGSPALVTAGSDPAWTRDGSRIVFARADGLYTVNIDGSDLRRLTTGKHRAPAWRP